MPNKGFINKCSINSGIRGGGGYLVLVNYPSLLSDIFPLASPTIIFFIQYKQNKLLRVSFIEIIEFCNLPVRKQENYNGIISHFSHSPLMQPVESYYAASFYATF